MKIQQPVRLLVFVSCLALPVFLSAQHGQADQDKQDDAQGPTTISIRETDLALCGTPFWDGLYALTVQVFALGANNVVLADYEQQVFALIRAADEFKGSAEAFIEHAKDIPRQLIGIIGEDPAVLDSCSNFSVALVGPP